MMESSTRGDALATASWISATRKDSESILIKHGDGVDPDPTLRDLFENGPIEITVFCTGKKRVKMGVQAPMQLTIWRKDDENY